MADIKPFVCVRPAAGMAEAIAALPYDVYSRAEAKAVVRKNPKSFLAIDRAETQFPDEVDICDARVYEKAAAMLRERIAAGDFVRDSACYYVYELTMGGRTQTGVVACACIDDYLAGVIKRHEETRADKEEDRIRHVDACSAQTGPIFLAYRADAVIRGETERAKEQAPLCDFVSEDGVRHRVFAIKDEQGIGRVSDAFSGIGSIYIADGHHRAASAVKVGLRRRADNPDYTGEEEFNYFLSVLFPDEELAILDYNRVVRDLNGMDAETFLSRVQQIFDVERLTDGSLHAADICEDVVRPKKKGEFSMFLDDCWYRCAVRPADASRDPVEGLDVSLLQRLLLEPVLGIRDPRSDCRIDFVGGIRGLRELERRCAADAAVAFAMYPTQIAELFAVADAGLLMPPKSTWFEPKLRSGLFIHEI